MEIKLINHNTKEPILTGIGNPQTSLVGLGSVAAGIVVSLTHIEIYTTFGDNKGKTLYKTHDKIGHFINGDLKNITISLDII